MATGIDPRDLDLLEEALAVLDSSFADLPEHAGVERDREAMRDVLRRTAERLADNYPYQHPLYAGQMLKPPHPVARLAYALAMSLNPNNHALDGGRASSAMEVEAVAEIAAMFGMPQHLGHLTGGGTMANLEALWVASRLQPGGRVLASADAHYTHSRICGVLGIPFRAVAVDRDGRMDLADLEIALAEAPTACVVATMGTTGLGVVDPLHEILERCAGVRVHCDAAYGGYFTLASELAEATRRQFDAMSRADSIVVDPHKHGLQPYGCGCVLFSDTSVGRLYSHDSPYTYFSSAALHLGEISLECSRAGAAAVALWATQRLLPLEPGGSFAAGLDAGLVAARTLHDWLQVSTVLQPVREPELDIVVFRPRGEDPDRVGRTSRAVFDAAAERGLHLALMQLDAGRLGLTGDGGVQVLRSVLLKPEHGVWLDEIIERLEQAAGKIG